MTVDEAAGLVWPTNAPAFFLLLIKERGWTRERLAPWRVGPWTRMLLA